MASERKGEKKIRKNQIKITSCVPMHSVIENKYGDTRFCRMQCVHTAYTLAFTDVIANHPYYPNKAMLSSSIVSYLHKVLHFA